MSIYSALFTEIIIQMSVLQEAEVAVKRASLFFVELTFGCFHRISHFLHQYGRKRLYFL